MVSIKWQDDDEDEKTQGLPLILNLRSNVFFYGIEMSRYKR